MIGILGIFDFAKQGSTKSVLQRASEKGLTCENQSSKRHTPHLRDTRV